MTRKHIHEEEFETTPERLFMLLVTPSSIRQWWSAANAIVIPKVGGTWTAAWGDDEDHPDYITAATIREFDAPNRMVLDNYQYHAKSGPLPFEADFVTAFVVSATPSGASLQVTQDGFPSTSDSDGFFAACQQGWQDTFDGIRAFLSHERAQQV